MTSTPAALIACGSALDPTLPGDPTQDPTTLALQLRAQHVLAWATAGRGAAAGRRPVHAGEAFSDALRPTVARRARRRTWRTRHSSRSRRVGGARESSRAPAHASGADAAARAGRVARSGVAAGQSSRPARPAPPAT